MITWQAFYESKKKEDIEEKEEELGKDLDGDGEVDEPTKHKKKVLGCDKCKKKKCIC
jgi:hypothetical protein